jgi:hypothetical protein
VVEDAALALFVSLECVDCILNFETGANAFESSIFWAWGAGGSFVIEGTVLAPDNSVIVSSSILLAGSFEGPVAASAAVGEGNTIRFSGSGLDQKNDVLLAYLNQLGFDITNNEFIYASTHLVTEGCGAGAGNSIDCDVVTADVANTNVPGGGGGNVPEPGLLALFGFGLIGVGSVARQRLATRR